MSLLIYQCFNASKTFRNFTATINVVKRYHILSNDSLNKSRYFENYKLFQRRESKLCNSYYVQQSSFHSLFEGYVTVFQALSESDAVVTTQNILTSFHDNTGLPWWGTVAVSTLLLRCVITMPLALYQQNILAKVENLKSELPPIVKELQHEVTVASKLYNWSPATATNVYQRSLKKQWNLLVQRDNCHPAKAGIVVLFQLPIWILLSMSIRNLVTMRPYGDEIAVAVFGEMEREGFLWVSNFTIPDGTMITSTLLCLVSLSIIEVNRLTHVQKSTKLTSTLINISRVFALITFPFALIVPSCLSFYWLTSATFGLIQNLIVMSPRLRSLVGIPPTPTTLRHPYKHLQKQIQTHLKIAQKVQE